MLTVVASTFPILCEFKTRTISEKRMEYSIRPSICHLSVRAQKYLLLYLASYWNEQVVTPSALSPDRFPLFILQ